MSRKPGQDGVTASELLQAQARKVERRDDELLREDLRELMSRPSGQRALWWIVEQTRFYRAFGAPLGDQAAHFDDGQRAVGAALVTALARVDADLFRDWLADGLTAELAAPTPKPTEDHHDA